MPSKFLIRVLIISISLAISNCSIYNNFFKKESTYYTQEETKILKETTEVLFFNYGFDVDTELEYVYSEVPIKDDIYKKDKEITAVIKRHKKNLVITFYKKIIMLDSKMNNRLIEYKENKEWKKHTYLKKYLIPPMKIYKTLLKKSVLSLYPDIKIESIVKYDKTKPAKNKEKK